MGEWTIELEGPPRFGEEGPYWVARFTVSDGLAESKSVQLKLTQHAETAFARAAKAQPMGPELMAKCAEERIEELLDGGKELPTKLSVEGYPGPDEAMVVTHLGAQLMLQRWGIDAQTAVVEPATREDVESTDAAEDAGAVDVELAVSEPAADAGNPAESASPEAEVPGADEVDAEALPDDSLVESEAASAEQGDAAEGEPEVEQATAAQAMDAEALLDIGGVEPEAASAEQRDAAEGEPEVERATFAQAMDAEALLDISLIEPEAAISEQGDAADRDELPAAS